MVSGSNVKHSGDARLMKGDNFLYTRASFLESKGAFRSCPLYDVEERLLLLCSVYSGLQSFDLDEFQVELVDEGGGPPRMRGALAAHVRCSQAPQLWIQQVHQLLRSPRIAATDGRHQAGDIFRNHLCVHVGLC
jgi:hypothetical protein